MRKKILRSRSGFEKPESREEAIMQNILGASNVLEPSESNIEEILKSILYNTPYTKEAESEIEKILLAIKNNGTYDGKGESRDMKILLAILRDLNYTEEAESRIEELFIEWLYQRSQIKVLEGVPPLTFTSIGLPLINYLIEGNTVQSGTPTPYNPIEPSGCGALDGNNWKIPISCGNQTTNVNLAEVQTTRRIKKLVFDGTEDWVASNIYYTIGLSVACIGRLDFIISHFALAEWAGDIGINKARFGGNINERLVINYDNGSAGLTAFKQWLSAQYAAGTPVTIWYVLAEPTTGIVNEPIHKIGNYADSIDMTQAGIQIPTARGNNVLTVETTIQPSNVYIEYK